MTDRIVTLYKREGSSDKVYQAEIHTQPHGLHQVVFRNARRGAALKVAKELPGLSLAAATEALERQVKAKMKDGYTLEESGVAYASSELAGRASGHVQQRPVSLTPQEARDMLTAPGWALQEKLNGERRAVKVLPDGQVLGINKRGLYVDVPHLWREALLPVAAGGGALLDGEQVGDTLHVFDLCEQAGQNLRELTLRTRLARLGELLTGVATKAGPIQLVPTYWEAAQREQIAARLLAGNREGWILKHVGERYTGGEGVAAYKFKFQESSTCQVVRVNEQRSVAVGLIGAAGQMVGVGNVTIPANHSVPEVGDCVEVQYLYFNPGGAFEQPVYLGRRHDVLPEECLLSQVTRLKPGVEHPDAQVDVARPRMRA